MLPFRLGIQQRVLPDYRRPFMDVLAQACANGLSVFAGEPRPDEMVQGSQLLRSAHLAPARNRHFFSQKAYLCWQMGFLEWLKNWQPDVLVVEANPRYLSTPAAVRWMRQRSRPVIGWGLGAPLAGGALGGFKRWLWRRFINQFDALIAYSSRGAVQYRALGIAAERVFVAPNAVAPRPAQSAPLRQPTFEREGPIALFVGRLQARKRLDVLFSACAALPSHLQPRLWVVGDGPARASLESQARERYPAAQFWGARHGAELDALFARADLFILPGTGGLAVQQAMSFALPVVVAEGDGTQADLVRPGNGWLVPPGDDAALAASLAQALESAPRLRQMGLESFRIVSEEVNLEAMVQVFIRAVERVCA